MTAPLTVDDAALAPNAKWRVDWGNTACIALQNYGDAQRPITFALKPSLDGTAIRLIVSRKGPSLDATHADIRLGSVATTTLGFTPRGSGMQIFWINIPRADFDRLAAGPTIPIVTRRISFTISTQGFAVAVKALDTCNANLRSYWNADEAGLARISVKAKPLLHPAKMVRPDDYPYQASREGLDGTTMVSLLIDEVGAIKDCVVELDSGVATIDAQTCLMIRKRGKFAAAQDSSGKPIRSRLNYRFRWQTK